MKNPYIEMFDAIGVKAEEMLKKLIDQRLVPINGEIKREMAEGVGKILGGLVIGGPAINVVMADAQSGNFMSIGNDVLFAYTGLGGTTPINFEQTLKGVGSIVGGIAIIKLFSWVAKRF